MELISPQQFVPVWLGQIFISPAFPSYVDLIYVPLTWNMFVVAVLSLFLVDALVITAMRSWALLQRR